VTDVSYTVDGGSPSTSPPAGVSRSGSTLNVDPANAAFNALAAGESTIIVVSYKVTDVHGATVNQTETITVTGTNDNPDIRAQSGDTASATLPEANAGLSTSGKLTVTDADLSDTISTTVSLTNAIGNKGALTDPMLAAMLTVAPLSGLAANPGDANNLTWTFNSGSQPFDFLSATDSLTLTYTLTVNDGHGGTDTQTVTIDIDGTNDAAVITGDDGGTIIEDDVPNTVSGDLNSTDVDGAADSFNAVATETASDNGYGTFVIAADGQWTYMLDNSNTDVNELFDFSQFLYDSFTVAAADGTTQVVNITIFGNNDPATITGPTTGEVSEETPANAGTPTATGDLSSSDPDGVPDDFFEVTTPILSVNGYGHFTVTDAGVWTYTLDNTNTDVDDLNDDDELSDSFLVHTQDGTSQLVTITIHGATDGIILAPIYAGNDDINNFDTKNDGTNVITGTNGNDVPLNGTNGANTIRALDGNDTVNALDGGDTVYGGTGIDTINGGDGNDDLYGQAGDDVIHGDGGNDEAWGGSGNDQIFGDANNDQTLWGGSGADTIVGGAGNDFLAGGFGGIVGSVVQGDTLTGGLGNDRFVFIDVRDRGDTITDFESGDRIQLSDIDANSDAAGDQGFTFGGTEATAHGVWYEHIDGNTLVYADTDGNAGTAEFWVTLEGTHTLDAPDFLLGP
jgi:VCBS repeat-containing protein